MWISFSRRRLLLYMSRHLPTKPESRYWVTGNYIFDYKDNKFGTLGMVHAMLIGDEINNVPIIGYFNFVTEALGKYTTEIGVSNLKHLFVPLYYYRKLYPSAINYTCLLFN